MSFILRRALLVVSIMVFSYGLGLAGQHSGDLTTGFRIDQSRTALPGGQQELIQLNVSDDKVEMDETDFTWSETNVESYITSNQGFVDVITGQDGNMYCAFYDDRTISGYPDHRSVYVRKSTDAGETWQNIDHGATGFAMAFLGGTSTMPDARPSVSVFQTSPGNYRIAVAICAGNPDLNRLSVVVGWKDIGSGNNWTTVYASATDFHFALPRIKAIPRPSNPSLTRLIISYVSLDYGYYISKYSDTNGAGFVGGTFVSDIDAWEMWRSDFAFDSVDNRLFCVWSMSQYDDPQQLPKVLIAMSEDRGQTWKNNIYQISPSGWNACAEAVCAMSENPLTLDRTLMVSYAARQFSSNVFRIEYTYQFLDHIVSYPSGSNPDWHISPAGYPVIRGTIYSDMDFGNTVPSIVSDNRISGGGYRVVFLDETTANSGRMLYTETGFETPFVWSEPEVVSAPNADPARQGGFTGVSSGVAIGTGIHADVRCAYWPDYRNVSYSSIICSRTDGSTVPPTATPEATMTPEPTNSPTSTPAPIPATSPESIAILGVVIGILILSGYSRKS